MSVSNSRRRAPRLETPGYRAYVLDLNIPLKLLDVATGGFGAASRRSFRPGDVHRFSIRTPQGETLVVSARATHCRRGAAADDDGYYVTGWQFVTTDENRRTVDRLLDSLTGSLTFY